MVYTTEVFTDNITMSPGLLATVKNTSAGKSLHQLTELLDVKRKPPPAD